MSRKKKDPPMPPKQKLALGLSKKKIRKMPRRKAIEGFDRAFGTLGPEIVFRKDLSIFP